MSQSVAKFNEETKVWTGNIGNYPHSMNTYFGELMFEVFDKYPEKVVQINHDIETKLIAKDLKIACIRVAQNLMKLGLKPDDVVGLNIRTSANVAPLVLACVLAGFVINPLHVSFDKEAIKHMFGKTNPKVVIVDHDVYDLMKEALDELNSDAKIFTAVEKIPGVSFEDELFTPTKTENKFVPPKFDKPANEKLTAVMCSSGTTGKIQLKS